MNYYLKQHPDVFIPERKELHFFGSDLDFKHDRSEATYKSQFDPWSEEKVGGEASVFYLCSTTAAREIREFNAHAKLIVMVRNPADMLHSFHSQTVFVGHEHFTEFEDALNAEQGRRDGTIPIHALTPNRLCYYSEMARFTEQIQNYVDTFGREQIHIIVFDDLKNDASKVFKETLDFLDVDPDFNADLRPINSNRKFKNKKLHYLVNDPHPGFRDLIKKTIPSSLLRWTKGKLQKANTKREPREKLKADVREKLNAMYENEVHSLGKFLDRDLTHWLSEK